MTDKKILNKIFNLVKKNFTYDYDSSVYGVDEKWSVPDETYDGTSKFKGDCEDFALACRKLCRDEGLDTRLVVCNTKAGLHCVLECEGWILDCSSDSVLNRDSYHDYKWLYISGYQPGDRWHRIEED